MRTQKLELQGKVRLPTVWRIPSIVFGGLGLAALVAVEHTEQNDWTVLGWVCASTLVYAITVLYKGFRDGSVRVLTDPFLILVGAFSLYFLFGPLLLVIGPENQAQYVLQWYPTTGQDAVRVTAMNLIGLATLLFAAGFLSGKHIEKFVQPAIAFFGQWPMRKIFWFFLIIGAAAKLPIFSLDMSNPEGIVVFGTFRTLAGLTRFAILVGILYQGRGAGVINFIAITVALLDFVMGLILFSKLAALMPIVLLLLSLYLRWPSLKLAVSSVVILAMGLAVFTGPIGDARLILSMRGDASFSGRLHVLEEVLGSNGRSSDDDSGMWSRLSYTVPQVAAVDLYEHNRGGRDIELLAWVFVPRALFPSKPIITRAGTDFNKKITGSATSSSGIGLFISGYYNLGWPGLFLASIFAAWILASFAAISRAAVSSGSMIILPVGLLGNFMAFRVDGNFVSDFLGPFGMVMVPFLALLFMLRVGKRKTSRRRAR